MMLRMARAARSLRRRAGWQASINGWPPAANSSASTHTPRLPINQSHPHRRNSYCPLRCGTERLDAALGVKSMVKLNDLLDLSFARLGNQR
jgi:hypothetical protein